jgi:hypothetical protein
MATSGPTAARPTTRPRPPVVASGIAGVAFSLLTAAQIGFPPQSEPFSRPTDYIIEALFLAGLVSAASVSVMLHRRHRSRGRWGRLGALGAALTGGGMGLLAVTVGATLLTGRDTLGMLFPLAFAAWALGGVLLAIAILRTRQLPRPVAVLFGAAVPLAAAIGEPVGPIALAALWISVAVTNR